MCQLISYGFVELIQWECRLFEASEWTKWASRCSWGRREAPALPYNMGGKWTDSSRQPKSCNYKIKKNYHERASLWPWIGKVFLQKTHSHMAIPNFIQIKSFSISILCPVEKIKCRALKGGGAGCNSYIYLWRALFRVWQVLLRHQLFIKNTS